MHFGVLLFCITLAIVLVGWQREKWLRLSSERLFWSYAIVGLSIFIISIIEAGWKFANELGFQKFTAWDASYPELIGLGGIGLGLIGIADTFALDAEKTRHERYEAAVARWKADREARKLARQTR